MADITVRECEEAVREALLRHGLPERNAEVTAACVVLADVWGISSHGLSRVPYYLARLEKGGCDPKAELTVTRDSGPRVAFEGNNGIGHWQLWRAAELAADRATTYGVGVSSVSGSSHCGALGIYTLPGLAANQVSLVFSNGPAVMPPHGGREAVLSTSPIAGGVPGGTQDAIVDMASSAVARGRIASAARRGEPLEEGWAFKAGGLPTTDASEALRGMLAPLGGPKGFALAYLVEALAGGVSGPNLSAEVADMFVADQHGDKQGIGHLVVSIDPVFADPSAIERIARMNAHIQTSGGRLPGSRRPRWGQVDSESSVFVEEQVWEMIRDNKYY